MRGQYRPRDLACPQVILGEERGQESALAFNRHPIEAESLPPDQPATPHNQELHLSLTTLLRHPEEVLVLTPGGDDPLALRSSLKRVNLVPVSRGVFVFLLVRRLAHLVFELPDDLPVLSLQEQSNFLYHLPVLLRSHEPLAGSQTPAQMILETARPPCDAATRPERKRAVDQGQQVPHDPGRHVRPEVERAVLSDAPDDPKSGKRVRDVQADKGIMLVVAKNDIIARPPLLDEIALQDQGLQLIRGQQIFHVGDLRDHDAEAVGIVAEVPIREIRLHPSPQGDRLAHVQQGAASVREEVHAGGIREALDLLVQLHTSP